jgi:hypothetical protein
MRNVLTFTKTFSLYDDSKCIMSEWKLQIRQNSCDDNARSGRPGASKCVEMNEQNCRCIYDNLRRGSNDITFEMRKTPFIRKGPKFI